jgi:Tfp pilus assembly protein PilO
MDRNFLVQTGVILVAAVGAWLMLVEPMVAETRKLENVIEDAQGRTADLQTEHSVAIARLPTIRDKVREIRRRNSLVSDTTELSASIFSLADEYGVEIRLLDPGGWSSGDLKRVVRINEIKMSVEGEYEVVARFVAAACELGGFIRPKSLELTPRQSSGDRRVVANCTLETMQFRIGEQLVSLEGADDQP